MTRSTRTAPSAVVKGWHERYAAVAVEWRAVSIAEQARNAAVLKEWAHRLEQLRATHRDLVQTGAWRGGPRTLLAALDLQYRELAMTAGFAWLLRPDGHHGLGSGVLTELLTYLGLDDAGAGQGVRIALEEQRQETRADLVIYGVDWTIVVEAKTFAVEQDRQLDRLFMRWQDEPDPHFVFLTRGTPMPITAVGSRDRWRDLTWQQVAEIARATLTSNTGAAPGVYDYIATLEAYHRV